MYNAIYTKKFIIFNILCIFECIYILFIPNDSFINKLYR